MAEYVRAGFAGISNIFRRRRTMARLVNDGDEALKYVEETIQSHKVVVFSKSYCPYCVKAKKLLEDLGANAFVIELDEIDSEDGSLIQAALKKKTNQSTVPNIFVSQKHLGGCDDVHKLHKDGKLEPLLK